MLGHHLATHSQAAAYSLSAERAAAALHLDLGVDQALAFLALQFETSSDGKVPEWIPLIPAGRVEGRDGRFFVNDHPELVINAFKQNAAPLPVDLEHATQLKGQAGDPAPAYGWIEELQAREGAIWARVEWTAQGRELIATRQYRFYSPAMIVHAETDSVVKLKGAGLTNQPNLYLPALHRQGQDPSHSEEEHSMSNAVISLAVLTALGLAATATERDAVAAIKKLEEDRDTALHRAQSPDLERFVPIATHKQVLARAEKAEGELKDIEQKHTQEEIDSLITQAVKDEKIAPADADSYRAACHKEGGVEWFKKHLETTPGITPGQADAGKDKKDGEQLQLNAEEKATAEQLGISYEDFAKEKAAHAA